MVQMQAWKSGIVKKLTGGVQSLVKGAGTAYVKATAEFLDAAQSQADVRRRQAGGHRRGGAHRDRDRLAADRDPRLQVRRQAGARQHLGARPDDVPKRMLCIGGGIIGLELGQTFQRLGTELIVLEGLGRILTGVRQRVRRCRRRQIKKDGGQIHVGAKAIGWEERDGQAVVKAEVGGKVSSSRPT
jgi:dihydrolipoamide dehydrogenase